jgi:hypothetical protein
MDEKTIHARLHDLLAEKFGEDWRREISLTLRADALYWLVFLAEAGIEAKHKEFKADKTSGASEVASLASWQMDLENLLARIKSAFAPPSKGKGK